MMNLIIDEGNTRTKAAVFESGKMLDTTTCTSSDSEELKDLINRFLPRLCIISSTRRDKSDFSELSGKFSQFIFLDHTVKTPLTILYDTPETLGKDRLAGAAGAYRLYKGKNLLVIDAGTAVTFDYVDNAGNYLGGTISPGLNMRLKALNTFTSKLPLVEPVFSENILGKNTHEAIQQGVFNGLTHEINGVCSGFLDNNPHGKVILTGGDAVFFEKYVKSTIFVHSNLVLIGLNTILEHNAN
ncbi:type III pantothenate kinase [Saccharicrinis sp. FJH54]|uniref:type III pantothenate kinase n=1 Tax=Saccharicrinis sp. FJH54 TaxID=3344665 RepID=UPI0035D491E1